MNDISGYEKTFPIFDTPSDYQFVSIMYMAFMSFFEGQSLCKITARNEIFINLFFGTTDSRLLLCRVLTASQSFGVF